MEARFLTGKGIGRYGSAQLPDATINPSTGSLTPLPGYHGMADLIFRPTPEWTLFVYGGIEHVDARYYDAAGSSGVTYSYGYGNPLFNNSGCETEGSPSCAANPSSIKSIMGGFWWKFYHGPVGNMQLGLTDNYVRREIHPGVGTAPRTSFAPDTNINILLLSFRYYPYQK